MASVVTAQCGHRPRAVSVGQKFLLMDNEKRVQRATEVVRVFNSNIPFLIPAADPSLPHNRQLFATSCRPASTTELLTLNLLFLGIPIASYDSEAYTCGTLIRHVALRAAMGDGAAEDVHQVVNNEAHFGSNESSRLTECGIG
jgi:hypothetical protein